MWLALSDGFLSVVKPAIKDIPASEKNLADPLMIRARKVEHLVRYFPGHRVYQWKGRDYPCRVFVERKHFAEFVFNYAMALNATNFKNSVLDNELHDAYAAIWGVMHGYQHGRYQPRLQSANPTFWDRLEHDAEDEPADDSDLDEFDMDVGGRCSHCSRADCTDDFPCPVCIRMAIDGEDFEERDTYGPFDTGEDESDTVGHLQVPPSP